MTVGFSDSHPTMYVVHGRAKPALVGQTSQSLTCSIMEKPHKCWMTVSESYCHALEKGGLADMGEGGGLKMTGSWGD